MITKREFNMLRSFRNTRFWRCMPQTAVYLWDKGLIKPTRFGMGNFELTKEGRTAMREFEFGGKNNG